MDHLYNDKWLGILSSSNKPQLLAMPHRGVSFGKVAAPGRGFGHIISHYIHVHRKGSEKQPPILYPGINVCLSFSHSANDNAAYVVGPRAIPRASEFATDDTDYFCVLFSQVGVNAILPLEQHELVNKALSLKMLFPKSADELTEKICTASSMEAKIQTFESFLKAYMDKFNIRAYKNIQEIDKMASFTGYRKCLKYTKKAVHTQRHANRLFLKYAGVSPKKFFRIVRGQKAIIEMLANPQCNLADLAYALDYYDQTHFINDFKAMYQITPKKFINDFFPSRADSIHT